MCELIEACDSKLDLKADWSSVKLLKVKIVEYEHDICTYSYWSVVKEREDFWEKTKE